ncbi:hypothetical protein LCGC14_2739850 [marine sediment metagenome]|uniref:DUF5673 domain-containing protein n=1 Tax=marine sediment metagenome TaxID=412755 RepID=A0A0F9BWG5_9ZZZZ
MAIEAPLSKYKKNNFKIAIAICIGLAIWFAYDGYFNKNFIEKHKDADGNPDSTLLFNQKSPPFFIGAAVLFGVYLLAMGNKKVIADENELIIGGKERLSYDSIQKIDKTHFGSKGYFIITYKNKNGGEVNRKLSDRMYDNLAAVLDELVAKIT